MSSVVASGVGCQHNRHKHFHGKSKLWKKIVIKMFKTLKKGREEKEKFKIIGQATMISWYNFSMAYIRKFKTTSGATGVQVCYKDGSKVVKTVHVGSAGSEIGLKRLLKKAQQIIDAGKQPMFNLDKYNKK